MIYLYLYLIIALYIAVAYVFLYHVYFMPITVKRAPKLEKLKVYGVLFVSIFVIAPYGLYEIIKEYKNGGFKK